eukprot:CAMPEP_0119270862 /NCGR_PEP_ID=MMETSP1329-20130426/7689_1 /TAXON_ID=114041 /ORGANISM="Genus nov. species nov., Strain RCC1024" /LENGTH=526 /DNA_ID=CAMNT_0007270895 /DNA_START=142 /DNA_END=1722 /DNA_ORIENTATION=+
MGAPPPDASARYLARCQELQLQPDPAVVTTLSTGWWLLAPSVGFGRGGLLPLLEVLSTSRTITELRLRADRRAPPGTAADARALAEALRENSSIKTLDCSRCGLDDVAVAELASGVRASKSLETVRLGQNCFHDRGCAALAEALTGATACGSLKLLDMSNNGLNFRAVSRVRRAVSKRGVEVDAVGNYTTEEMLSALTHGVAFAFAAVGAIPLLSDAWALDRPTFWACSLYQFTLLVCFLSSTFYHAHFANPFLMNIWQRIDHMGIFLLIAGSYTPLLFVGCRGHAGVAAVVVLEWCAAAGGCIVSATGLGLGPNAPLNVPELATFLAMGAGFLPVLGPVSRLLAPEALFLVALGGVFYLIGIWPFVKGGQHPGWHVVWHFFVMAGAATHWFCVYLYILPAAGQPGGAPMAGLADSLSREDLQSSVSELRSAVLTASLPHLSETALISHLLLANATAAQEWARSLPDHYRQKLLRSWAALPETGLRERAGAAAGRARSQLPAHFPGLLAALGYLQVSEGEDVGEAL